MDDETTKRIATDVTPGERLTAEEFLAKLREPYEWHVVSGHSLNEFIELYVIIEGEVHHYLAPDFISMEAHEAYAFFEEFNILTATGVGGIIRRLAREHGSDTT